MSIPAYAGPSKEMVELQVQVQQLLKMQQSIDEKMGVLQDRMNTLSVHVNEHLKNLTLTADKLDKTLRQQAANTDSCVDQVTGQAQPLHDSLTELRAQIAAMSKQLNDMNATTQSTTPQGNAQAGAKETTR